MSELEKYRELYNQFVSLLVELHNLSVSFNVAPTERDGFKVRKVYRSIRVIEKKLWRSSKLVSKEHRVLTRLKTQQEKQRKAEERKLNPKKPGPKPKKDKQNDNNS